MGRTAVTVIVATVFLLNPVFVVVGLMHLWNIKTYTLLTPPAKIDISFSLFNAKMEMACPEGWTYCNTLREFEGTHEIAYWRDYSCAVHEGTMGVLGGCDVLIKLYWVSMGVIFCIVFSCVIADIAAFYLYYYFFHSQKKLYRKVYTVLFIIAPLFNFIGVASYMAFCNDISQLFRFIIPGSPIQPVLTTYDGTTLDMGPFMFIALTGALGAMPLVINLFVGVHVRETFLLEEKERLKSEGQGLYDPLMGPGGASDFDGGMVQQGGQFAGAGYDQQPGYGGYAPGFTEY